MKTDLSLISRFLPSAGVRAALLLVSAIAAVSATSRAQTIFVADPNTPTNGVRSYNINGTLINSSLISGTSFQGLALSGSTLYVANTGGPSVGAYTLNSAGAVTASSPNYIFGSGAGVTSPYGLTVSATNLFIGNFNSGNVLKYNLSGTQVGSLSVGTTNPYGLAVSGDTLFVSQATTGSGANTIKAFSIGTSSGNFGTFTPTFSITTNLNLPHGLAVSGTTLFVANGGDGTIGKFDVTTGVSTGTLISGLTGPQGITVYGTSLFVTGSDGTIKGFDASTGAVLAGFTTITGLSSPNGIVVGSMSAIPEPSTYAAIAGAAMLGLAVWHRRRRPSPAATLAMNAAA